MHNELTTEERRSSPETDQPNPPKQVGSQTHTVEAQGPLALG